MRKYNVLLSIKEICKNNEYGFNGSNKSYSEYEAYLNEFISHSEYDNFIARASELFPEVMLFIMESMINSKDETSYCSLEFNRLKIYHTRTETLFNFFELIHECSHAYLFYNNDKNWFSETRANYIEKTIFKDLITQKLQKKYILYKHWHLLHSYVNVEFEKKKSVNKDESQIFLAVLLQVFPMFDDMNKYSNAYKNDDMLKESKLSYENLMGNITFLCF